MCMKYMAKFANPDLCSYRFYRMQNHKHQQQQQQHSTHTSQKNLCMNIFISFLSHVVSLLFSRSSSKRVLHETKQTKTEDGIYDEKYDRLNLHHCCLPVDVNGSIFSHSFVPLYIFFAAVAAVVFCLTLLCKHIFLFQSSPNFFSRFSLASLFLFLFLCALVRIVCYHCRVDILVSFLELTVVGLFCGIIKITTTTTTTTSKFKRILLCRLHLVCSPFKHTVLSVQCFVVSHGENIQILSNFAYNEILTVSKHKLKNKKIEKRI